MQIHPKRVILRRTGMNRSKTKLRLFAGIITISLLAGLLLPRVPRVYGAEANAQEQAGSLPEEENSGGTDQNTPGEENGENSQPTVSKDNSPDSSNPASEVYSVTGSQVSGNTSGSEPQETSDQGVSSASTIEIISFEPLAEDITYQNFEIGLVTQTDIVLPDILWAADHEGARIRIEDVRWICTGGVPAENLTEAAGFEPDKAGCYLFVPVIPEGFSTGESAALPNVFVTVFQAVRMAARATPADENGNYFFTAIPTEEVLGRENMLYSLDLVFTPSADMRQIALTTDPLRAGEADFSEAIDYTAVTWKNGAITDEEDGQVLQMQVFYQLSSDANIWHSAGEPASAGYTDLQNVALAQGERITRLQFCLFGDDGAYIPAGSSPVLISILGLTKSNITSSGKSYSDNILTTGTYLTGEILRAASGDFETVTDDGTANARISGTNILVSDPAVGLAGWENPVSPNPLIPGENFTYSMRYYTTNSIVSQPVSYVIVGPGLQVFDVETDARFPDASWSVKTAANGCRVIKVEWNQDNSDPWTQYAVTVRGKVKSTIESSAYFRYLLASDDPAQRYSGGNAGTVNSWYLNQWQDTALIDEIGGTDFGASYRSTVGVDRPEGLLLSHMASTGTNIYSPIKTVDTSGSSAGVSGYFLLMINNTTSAPLEEVRIIGMLPQPGDTLAISSDAKNSTVQPRIDAIELMTGNPLPGTCQVFYTEDIDAAAILAELSDFTNTASTWIPWDGSTPLPSSAKALRLIKTDGLSLFGSFDVHLKVTLPQNTTEETLVAWNAMAVGGRSGADTYIMPEEPDKSGFYISSNTADHTLSGTFWEDENGNDIRDPEENLLQGIEVLLYDAQSSLIDKRTTDALGNYRFENLLPDVYSVKADIPDNMKICSLRAGDEKTADNDFTSGADWWITSSVDLSTETHPENIDAGLYKYASLKGTIWTDSNANGLRDSYEPVVSAAHVTLLRLENGAYTPLHSQDTSSAGGYLFSDLKPGVYQISVDPIYGHIPTLSSVGGPNSTQNSKLTQEWKTGDISLASGQKHTVVNGGITSDGDRPQLSVSTVHRTSLTEAYIQFTSSKAGQIYYKVVDSGTERPSVNVGGTGADCGTTEQIMNFSSLTDGSKDVYLIVKDALGNISPRTFYVRIPNYVPPSPPAPPQEPDSGKQPPSPSIPSQESDSGKQSAGSASIPETAAILSAIQALPANLKSIGGISTITITGSFLPNGITLGVFEGTNRVTGDWATASTSGTKGQQSAEITFPKNTTTSNKAYTVKASLDGGINWLNTFSASVTVVRSAAATADASRNSFQINGGKVFTVTAGTTFTITAAGSRQDEAGIQPGDQRYIPVSASANSTVNFTESNGIYTSQMTIKNSGSYTLAVIYQLQEWDGSAWQTVTGNVDTKTTLLTVKTTEESSGAGTVSDSGVGPASDRSPDTASNPSAGTASDSSTEPGPGKTDESIPTLWLLLGMLPLAAIGALCIVIRRTKIKN